MLRIKNRDIGRATLPLHSGNEGWIGVSPRGDAYHVVVPVDVQIARGVRACNRPTDGTPFGGYSNWLYFRCPPYEEEGDERAAHEERIRQTAEELIGSLAAYGIEAEIEADDHRGEEAASTGAHAARHGIEESGARMTHLLGLERSPDSSTRGRCSVATGREICCPGCAKRWKRLSEFLRDPDVILDRYRACLDDFREGKYLFTHSCGGQVEVGVLQFARPSRRGGSLIGTHACPGMCHYETSFRSCSAACEGSCYRRIAIKLKSRSWGCKAPLHCKRGDL